MLKLFRIYINIIDSLLVYLLNMRFSVAKKIGQYKKIHNIRILDNTREQQVIDRLSKKEKYPNMIKTIWITIMNFSKDLQKNL